MIPDIHVLVRKALLASTGITDLVGDRVYAGDYPRVKPEEAPNVTLPAIRFRFPFADPLSDNTTAWWAFSGQVEAHAETEGNAGALEGAILAVLLGLEGTSHAEGIVQGVRGWGLQSGVDGEWSPPRPQRIVAVTLTARTT